MVVLKCGGHQFPSLMSVWYHLLPHSLLGVPHDVLHQPLQALHGDQRHRQQRQLQRPGRLQSAADDIGEARVTDLRMERQVRLT